MRLARRSAGWALTAAGTFGLSVAAAQLFLEQSPAAPPPAVLPSVNPSAADTGYARVVEIRVELAWLADSNTFPYDMVAHSDGTSVEVGGVVPSAAAHDRAMEVAREHSPLPVLDRLLIKSGSGNLPGKMGDANLCRAAGSALAKMLAGRKEPFQVAADPHGQITLLGTVPSCEEKLRISRRMSQLPGCTSVINSMVVGRVNKNGQIYTVVSLDGKHMVAGDPLDLLPPPSVAMPTSPVVVQGQGPSPSSEAAVGVVSVDVAPPSLPPVKNAPAPSPAATIAHVESSLVPPPPAANSGPSLAASVVIADPVNVPPPPFPAASSGPSLSAAVPAEPARPALRTVSTPAVTPVSNDPLSLNVSVPVQPAPSTSAALPPSNSLPGGAVVQATWNAAVPAKSQQSPAPASVSAKATTPAAPAKPQPSQTTVTAKVMTPAAPPKMLPVAAQQVIQPVPAATVVTMPLSPYGGCVPRPTGNFIVAAPARPGASTAPSMLPASLAAAPVVSQPVRAIPVASNGPITLVSGTESGHLTPIPVEESPEEGHTAHDAGPQFEQPESQASPRDFATIKHLIESMCSKSACHVEVKPLSDDRVGVTLHVHSAAEGQALGERLFGMPELGDCHLDLLIDVK